MQGQEWQVLPGCPLAFFVAYTPLSRERGLYWVCIQGILPIEKTQESSKCSINHIHDAVSIIIHANITLVS